MPERRTIIDRPRSGAWNMAIDEVLIERAAADKQPQLRLYTWQPATLSLGYFQRAAERHSHPASRGCPLVRRPSGGGAIIHDREITYCLCIPGDRIDGAAVYRRVHAALVDTLRTVGIKAELVGAIRPEQSAATFLCFQRWTVGDVVVDGHKIIGSAQRRRRGALLQHGSILLQASPAAPDLPGIADLTARCLDRHEWMTRLTGALLSAIDCSLCEGLLTDAEIEHARQLVQSKYAAAGWNDLR